MYFANVDFVKFEQVNVYLQNINVWSLKLFASFMRKGNGN